MKHTNQDFQPYPVQIPGTKQYIDIAPFLNYLSDNFNDDYEILLIEKAERIEDSIRLIAEFGSFEQDAIGTDLRRRNLFQRLYDLKDLFDETMIIEQIKK